MQSVKVCKVLKHKSMKVSKVLKHKSMKVSKELIKKSKYLCYINNQTQISHLLKVKT
jgi:hypothetical protein